LVFFLDVDAFTWEAFFDGLDTSVVVFSGFSFTEHTKVYGSERAWSVASDGESDTAKVDFPRTAAVVTLWWVLSAGI